MSKRGHREEQILHEAEGGTRISNLCRERGIRQSPRCLLRVSDTGFDDLFCFIGERPYGPKFLGAEVIQDFVLGLGIFL